ncbi:MAG: class I SAM-dependent methyltransferase [Bacteroidota bacterium]
MSNQNDKRICPVEQAGNLDSLMRKLLQPPKKILKRYIQPDMTVLDLGCGPGYFLVPMARMLNETGKIIALDIQQGMLDLVKRKMEANEISNVIELENRPFSSIGYKNCMDFILAFYVIHEIPEQEKLFRTIHDALKQGGKLFVSEPVFHVKKEPFQLVMENFRETGLNLVDRPSIFFSRTAVFEK